MNRRGFFCKVLSGVAMLGLDKSVAKTPTFAKGGVFNGPTYALVGQGVQRGTVNSEVIATLDKLKTMISGQDIRIIMDRNNKTAGIYLN